MQLSGETGGRYDSQVEAYAMPLDESLFRAIRIGSSQSDVELLEEAATVLPTKYPQLEHAQVLELARTIQYSDSKSAIDTATDTLVRHNIKLAFWGAKRAQFERVYMPFPDVVQAAMLGVYKAAQRFDPDRGLRFGTYAPYWMQTTIRKETARYLGVPRHVLDAFPATYRAADRLKTQLGRMPSVMDLATEMDVTPRAIANQMMYRQRVRDERQLTLDSPVQNDSKHESSVLDHIVPIRAGQVNHASPTGDLALSIQRLEADLDAMGSSCLGQILDGRKDIPDIRDQFNSSDAKIQRQYSKVQSLLRHPFYGILAAIDPEYAWQNDALCKAKQNRVVVAERFQGQLQAAREFCGSCIVRDQCLQIASEGERPVVAGIWAGMMPASIQK